MFEIGDGKMDQLSGLDASFLYLETAEMPMHVGSFCLYEKPAGLKGSMRKAIQAHIAKRLHLAPIFTRKLKHMPLELGHPVWIQSDKIDLNFHIRSATSRTLTVREAEEMCARIHAQRMDRDHPLWEFHVFERIKRPDGSICAGLYSRVHHSALDGKGGTVLAQAIMDVSPIARDVAPPDMAGRPRRAGDPNAREMLGSLISGSLGQYIKLIKAIPTTTRALASTLVKQSTSTNGQGTHSRAPMRLAPMTDFNVAVTTERTFGTAHFPLAPCREMAQSVNGTVNDVVLWLCATALRSYMAKHGGLPKKSMLAAMPISLREEGNKELNTQASMTAVELGTQLVDPRKRMKVIMASTARVKRAMLDLKGILPTDYPSLLAPWIVGAVSKAAYKAYEAGLSHRLPMLVNLVISNVPGPQVPLYMAGAKMLTFHPLSIVTHGVALNITIQTYAGFIDFGLVADRTAVPAIDELTDALTVAFEEGRLLFIPEKAPAANIVAKKPSRAKKSSADSKKRYVK